MKAIINATPLIALTLIEQFELLNQLFEAIYVPTSVYEEVVMQGNDRPGMTAVRDADWLIVQSPRPFGSVPMVLMELDLGERDVILLGQELAVDWLIIDERLGRKIAQAMGFRVKGTLGLLLLAHQVGFLTKSDAIQSAKILSQSLVRLSPALLEWFYTQLSM